MSVRAILLRLLLCVALVLNGAAQAMASAQMMRVHAQAGGMADSANMQMHARAEAAPPCHDAAQPQGHADSTAPSKTPHPAAPDCCQSGACTCACVSPVVAMMPALAFHAIAPNDAGNIRPMTLGHAAPALPHLIRPPIG